MIKDELSDYIEGIEFEDIYYPKQYNFTNNSIDCIVIPNIEKIKNFIYENKEAFCEYLKERYTGYDGFIPSYSNEFETWEAETKNFTNFSINGHCLGSILDFIALKLEIEEINLYYNIKDGCFDELEYIENLDIILSMPICSKCDKMIENTDIMESIEKYKKVMGKNPSTIHCKECLENN